MPSNTKVLLVKAAAATAVSASPKSRRISGGINF